MTKPNLSESEMTPTKGATGKTNKKSCENLDHDFKHLKRYGRADWRCPKCGDNVMLLIVLAQQAGIDLTE